MSDIVTELRAGPVCWQIMDKAATEIEMLREELDTWKSVFPDIAPEQVQPDRSLLEKEIKRLQSENHKLRTSLHVIFLNEQNPRETKLFAYDTLYPEAK